MYHGLHPLVPLTQTIPVRTPLTFLLRTPSIDAANNYYACSGARIQEGADSLAGYADIFQRNVDASGVVSFSSCHLV